MRPVSLGLDCRSARASNTCLTCESYTGGIRESPKQYRQRRLKVKERKSKPASTKRLAQGTKGYLSTEGGVQRSRLKKDNTRP